MSRVLILHGWGGSDYPHWQSWLAGELAKDYGIVAFPKLEDIDKPNLDEWLEQLCDIVNYFKPNIVVCHSLANTLWFWYASGNENIKLDKLFLVAMPSLNTNQDELSSFFPAPMPESLGAKETYIVASNNDIWCSVDEAKEIANHYGANFKLLESAGHINDSSGYGKWEWIKEMVKK